MPEAAISEAAAKRVEDLCRWAASISLVVLLLGGIAWEGTLAPLRPGGSWLILKVLPLLFPLSGVLHGRRYTYQWSSMLVLLYFAEGAVRAWSDPTPSAWFAVTEVVLSLIFFIAALGFSWLTRPSLRRNQKNGP